MDARLRMQHRADLLQLEGKWYWRPYSLWAEASTRYKCLLDAHKAGLLIVAGRDGTKFCSACRTVVNNRDEETPM